MIGTALVSHLSPLDYRLALDAAMPLLAGRPLLVRSNLSQLEPELRSRIVSPAGTAETPRAGALWIEPLVGNGRQEIREIGGALVPGACLVVVMSRPAARRLPERRGWSNSAIGLRPGGVGRLSRALAAGGFVVEREYGLHSLPSVCLGVLSRLFTAAGRPALAERLHFTARSRYVIAGPLARWSTVALLIARKR